MIHEKNQPSLTKKSKVEYGLICKVFDGQDWDSKEKEEMKSEVERILRRDGKINYQAFPPGFRWDICCERLKTGDFSNWDGWEFRSDWAMTFRWGEGIKTPVPKWDGKPTDHLVILGEQGIGDEILFLSALPDLMVRVGKKCLELQTYPRLKTIVERSYGIRCTDRRLLSHVTEGKSVMALGDLFPWYRRSRSHFPKKPYLKADPEKVAFWVDWMSQFGPKNVGLAWKTRKGSVEPESLRTGEGTYFDLQYGEHKTPEWMIKPPFDIEDDMENLFAFVKALDRVDSVTQTLCHVAGSQGVECNAIIPPDNGEVRFFLWCYGSPDPVCESPVYPNMKVYKNINEFRACRS